MHEVATERLFLDCDDTLIIYDDSHRDKHPYGVYMGTPWPHNMKKIYTIKRMEPNVRRSGN